MYDILDYRADWNTESARSAIYSIFSASGAYFDVSRQKYHILMFCDKKLFLNKTELRPTRCMSSLPLIIYLPNTQLQVMPACDTSSFKLSQALWFCLQALAWLVESLLRYSTLISPTIMYNILYWTSVYTILFTIHYTLYTIHYTILYAILHYIYYITYIHTYIHT